MPSASLLRHLASLACAAAALIAAPPRDQRPIVGIEHTTDALLPDARPPIGPLRCSQVAQPVPGPHGPLLPASSPMDESSRPRICTSLLMEHSFGFSYGKPFVADYTPPKCDFDRVVVNLTVTSAGRQFDRLAVMFLNDTEVWRTSTAEPKPAPGIEWTFLKDMTQYLSLWKSPQKLIFDLGNLIDDKYTGSFNCTLEALFFTSDRPELDQRPADLVIPISAKRSSSNQGSAWSVPQQKATALIDFPQDANRAVFSISANGQMAEEFWWSNLLQSDAGVFNETVGRMPGLSPFREVQLFIDDRLAGVQWPFPVVFTGGVSPGLHRPVVGIDAFNLREHEIDITPWLPVLSDGKAHKVDIQVKGIYDNGELAELTDRVDHYWVVTGKIFVWQNEDGAVVTGAPPTVEVSNPVILMSSKVAQNGSGINSALDYSLHVQRTISISGEIVTGGQKQKSTWTQELMYSNLGAVTSYGSCQINDMNITGFDRARGHVQYDAAYSFPLWANQSMFVSATNNLTIEAQLNQSLHLKVLGHATFPTGLEAFQHKDDFGGGYEGSRLWTSRNGSATFSQSGDKKHSSGHGSTQQIFSFSGLRSGGSPLAEELYFRNISAANDTIMFDHEVVGHEMHKHSLQLGESPEAEDANEYQGHFAPPERKSWILPGRGEFGEDGRTARTGDNG